MRSTIFGALSLASLGLLSACGPSRLSDADVTRLCTFQVSCGGGLSQASCESIVRAQRDAENMAGCGGQFGALSRCALHEAQCTGVPEACLDEQMRLEQCHARRSDAGTSSPDSATGCTPSSSEEGTTLCADGCDNDEDGVYDCNEESCCGSVECGPGTVCGGGSCTPASETSLTYCEDGCDNDGNGVYDCNDSGCCEALSGLCGSGTVCGGGSCTPASFEEGSTYCTDGCDNDSNGVYDCNESACCASLSGACATGTLCGGGGDVSARTSSGFLEVYYSGEWRPVCDDSFDMADANVACRMMGYSGAETFTTSVTGTNESFWLDDLGCTGTESSLADCTHSGWGVENCGSTECVQVVCF
ncbi:MAG: scavenger receptor cysteine-rich domain-containing protein [Sandaracinaceae bacterium]|nr:scavenger receptor cysteine-rich domain-containing protein [Sandaracinaceae bacterium]